MSKAKLANKERNEERGTAAVSPVKEKAKEMNNSNHWAPEKLDNALQKEDWRTARQILQAALKQRPKDHWLLTRMAMTFYEDKDYNTALKWSEHAIKERSECPLVNWDYACILDMLDRTDEAIGTWQRLLNRGVDKLAKEECSEGHLWAQSLVNDVRFRLGLAYEDKGDLKCARKMLKEHLKARRPGLFSLYRKTDVESALNRIDEEISTSKTSASVDPPHVLWALQETA